MHNDQNFFTYLSSCIERLHGLNEIRIFLCSNSTQDGSTQEHRFIFLRQNYRVTSADDRKSSLNFRQYVGREAD